MTSDWIDGVTRVPSGNNGGGMLGGPVRFVHHTYEAPYALTAEQGAASLIRAGNEIHFVFHPHGGLVQILPATVAGRGLVNAAGGVQTNREGTVCLQVEVIGYADRPWTLDLTPEGRVDLQRMIDFGRSHGIPDVWPAGPPPAYPPGDGNRSTTIWTTRSGHWGHSQVPENSHGDPGAIDVTALFADPAPTILEDAMILYRARTASADGTVPAGAIMSCAVNQRWHIPGTGSPLVVAAIAAGVKVVDVDGQDIVDAFPIDAGKVTVPAGGLTLDQIATAVADKLAARIAS